MSEIKKVYRNKEEKSTKSLVAKREKRRQTALTVFSMAELAKHLKLQRDGKPLCPNCKESDKLEITKSEFKCKSCKQKGHAIKFVKLALNLSDWKAIYHIEELAKQKTSKQANEPKPKSTPQKQTKPTNTTTSTQPKQRIEKIKSHNKISDIVTRYANVTFKTTRNATMCRCPFPDHEDKTPSFSVNDAKSLFHCFGCSRKGDVIAFVQQFKNCSFKDALDLLDPPAPNSKPATDITVIPQKTSKWQLLKRCTEVFHDTLLENQSAQQFLQDRGLFDGEMVKHFAIGFDDGKINQLLSSEHIETLSELGVINGNDKCRFYRSLTVPLWDADGNAVSIYGRRISTDKNNKGSKHQFAKGNLNGLFNATVFKAVNEIILTEGIIDGLSLWTMGFKNVSSIFSAANIPSLLIDQLVKHGVEKIYLAFDNDDSGDNACLKLQRKLASFDIQIARVRFPEGIKDANELVVKYGKDKAAQLFSSLIANSKPLQKQNQQPQRFVGKDVQIEWEKRKGRVIGVLDYEIELIARERGALRVLIIATKHNHSHTDKLDLFRSQARTGFANSVARRFDLAAQQIESELEQILLYLRKLPGEAFGKAKALEDFVTTYTAKERKEAEAWLKSENFFATIAHDYDLIGYVGENEAKQIAYLSASSRKMSNPIPLIIRATSAGGKSALMEATSKLVPDEDVLYLSEISKQALYYLTTERIQHKLIIIDERKGSEEADYSIRTLLSRGLLRKAVPTREVDGEIRTIIKELRGPISYMESTTDVNIHPENENRCLTL